MSIGLALMLSATASAVPAAPDTAIVARNAYVVMRAYPKTSLHRGEEGVVGFRIKLNREGLLDSCQVTRSSGYQALDTATCDMLLKGATATPLRTDEGDRIAGYRDGLVEWTLPATARRPAQPPRFTTSSGANGETLICRRKLRAGSSFIREKICLTAADWRRQSDHAQQQTQDMQTPRGPLDK